MQKLQYVIPECFVDTNVIQTLIQKKGVNHQMSCSQVIKVMSDKFSENFAVGIIDADKKEPRSINDFNVFIGKSEELTLLKKENKPHYLVKINNVMETFLLHCAKEIGYDMSQLGIESTLAGLKRITKIKSSQENPVVTKLVKKLRPSTSMNLLSEILLYLMENQYSTSTEELKNMFEKHPHR